MVTEKFSALVDEIGDWTGLRPAPVEVAEGFFRIAVDAASRAVGATTARLFVTGTNSAAPQALNSPTWTYGVSCPQRRIEPNRDNTVEEMT